MKILDLHYCLPKYIRLRGACHFYCIRLGKRRPTYCKSRYRSPSDLPSFLPSFLSIRPPFRGKHTELSMLVSHCSRINLFQDSVGSLLSAHTHFHYFLFCRVSRDDFSPTNRYSNFSRNIFSLVLFFAKLKLILVKGDCWRSRAIFPC
jgi:hypothetical protein